MDGFSIITLLTDFGLDDPFAGIMKGVIYGIAPLVKIVDITHNVSSYSIFEGAFKLKAAYRFFPRDTIHVVVIDPDVGSDRAILLVHTKQYLFIAPDNGVLSLVSDIESPMKIFSVTNRDFFLPEMSTTFHGRDIFAPVAAHLAIGAHPEDFGPPVEAIKLLPRPCCSVEQNMIRGEIIYIDRFGNLISSVSADMLKDRRVARVLYGSKEIDGISSSYTQGAGSELIAIVNSFDHVEISAYRASAQELLEGKIHDKITVELEEI